MNKALFLDRDGVINHDYGYVYRINDFEFKKGIFKLVKRANLLNYFVIVVTNQAGIGRGYYSEEQFLNLNSGFVIDKIPNGIPEPWIKDKITLNILPHLHGIDGVFAMRMKKIW